MTRHHDVYMSCAHTCNCPDNSEQDNAPERNMIGTENAIGSVLPLMMSTIYVWYINFVRHDVELGTSVRVNLSALIV